MSNGTAIFLCDISCVAAQPWVDAGYRAVLVDPQHQATSSEGQIEKLASTILEAMPRLAHIIRTENVVFVMGFPPCTDVAVSGARWFADKREKDPHFQAKAALVAEQCRMVGMASGAPWAFENPVSVFSGIFGKPDYTFNPHDFTGHCVNDNYTKKTCLWAGGGFVMPQPHRDDSLGAPDNRIHACPPSNDRANIRSKTPAGFARAVFLANAPHLRVWANDNAVAA